MDINQLRQEVLLRSAVASACIEGNPMTYKEALAMQRQDIEEALLPKRREILNTIREHKQVSFDFIRRRFLAIPASTLRYDLRQLAKQNLIKKLGVTRGAVYSPAEYN